MAFECLRKAYFVSLVKIAKCRWLQNSAIRGTSFSFFFSFSKVVGHCLWAMSSLGTLVLEAK